MISINYAFIIVILNFILLLIVLNKLLYKPIKQFLAERQKQIGDDIDKADRSKQEAQELVKQKKDELKSSTDEIRKLKNAARRDAESQASDILKNAKEVEKKMKQDTEHQIAEEKKKALAKVEGELAGLVSELSAKFLSEKVDDKSDEELIAKILAERGEK